jgi:hypothetical protein
MEVFGLEELVSLLHRETYWYLVVAVYKNSIVGKRETRVVEARRGYFGGTYRK